MLNKINLPLTFSITNATTSNQAFPKPLPSIGSLLFVKILEQQGSGYKILVNNSLFTTQLSLSLPAGESFLAKIAAGDPLTLQTGKFTTPEKKPALLQKLLSLFDGELTELSKGLLKELLEKDRVVLKERIQGMDEFIKDNGIKQSELMNLLFMRLYDAGDEHIRFIFEKQKESLSFSIEDIYKKILSLVVSLSSKDLGNQLALSIANTVFPGAWRYAISEGQEYARDEHLLALVQLLEHESENNAHTQEMRTDSLALAITLTEFLIKRAFFAFYGIFPDFLITFDTSPPQIITLLTSKLSEDTLGATYTLGTVFEQSKTRKLTVKGVTNEQRWFAEISTIGISDKNAENLQHNLEKVVEELFGGTPFIKLQ